MRRAASVLGARYARPQPPVCLIRSLTVAAGMVDVIRSLMVAAGVVDEQGSLTSKWQG